MTPKYPNIKVKLVGKNGNAFFVLGLCQRAAQKARLPKTEIDAFMEEAKSGDYDYLLRTCMAWFDCD